MTTGEIKRKMMKLWKDTFHDSDEYISLIFENYFNPEWIEYHKEGEDIVSALMGIPYTFSNGRDDIKGLYLCGLATKEQFRHRGIMINLIEKVNQRAKERDFAFTFLIPATDRLRIFYQNHGYMNGLYRVEERYTNVHDFRKDCMSIINREEDKVQALRKRYFDELSATSIKDNIAQYNVEQRENINSIDNPIENITAYISNNERQVRKYAVMRHSEEDIKAMIRENKISGGDIFITLNSDNKITGTAFVTFDEKRNIVIPKIYYDEYCSYYRLLEHINSVHPTSSILIYRYPEETQRYALWSKVYGAANPDGGMLGGAYGMAERVYNACMFSIPYGMVRLLNLREILIFLSKDRKDLKFSILVKGENNTQDKSRIYHVRDGQVTIDEIDNNQTSQERKNRDLTVLNFKELTEIILRKKDGNSLIMEAFGIPRLAMNMALLLD